MGSSHERQRPARSIQERIGTLSSSRIALPHFGHADAARPRILRVDPVDDDVEERSDRAPEQGASDPEERQHDSGAHGSCRPHAIQCPGRSTATTASTAYRTDTPRCLDVRNARVRFGPTLHLLRRPSRSVGRCPKTHHVLRRILAGTG